MSGLRRRGGCRVGKRVLVENNTTVQCHGRGPHLGALLRGGVLDEGGGARLRWELGGVDGGQLALHRALQRRGRLLDRLLHLLVIGPG